MTAWVHTYHTQSAVAAAFKITCLAVCGFKYFEDIIGTYYEFLTIPEQADCPSPATATQFSDLFRLHFRTCFTFSF